MKKKILIIAVILLALLAGTMLLSRKNTPKAETGKELLKNGGFEEVTGEGLPAHWLADAYVRLPGMTEFAQAEGSSGKGARIVNHEPNDARFYQTVEVVPGAVYRLSGKIKARADGGHGANLSIQDVYVFSESVYDSGTSGRRWNCMGAREAASGRSRCLPGWAGIRERLRERLVLTSCP